MNNLLNQLLVSFPLKGEEMKRWALELLAVLNWLLSEAIFSKALANPSGYLVNNAPDASAKNSLFLEMDN